MISPEFLAALPWVEIPRSKAISRVAWVPEDDALIGSLYIEERKSKHVYRYENAGKSVAATLVFSPSPGFIWNLIREETPGEWVNDPRPCVGFDAAFTQQIETGPTPSPAPKSGPGTFSGVTNG